MIKREITIQKALQQIEGMQKALVNRLQKLSPRALTMYKRFINRCNSLFIIFSQFELLTESLNLMHKALSIDLKTYFDPQILDKAWKGRILLYINVGYLMMIIGDLTSSMKFLYDAESLILESKQYDSDLIRDLYLTHSVVSALAAFRAKRFKTAEKYIENASDEFNVIIRGERYSKITKSGCYNLYCMLTLMLEVLKSYDTGLVSTTNSKLVAKRMKKHSISAFVLLDEYNENSSVDNGMKLIKSVEFRNILSATVLFPFIVKSTPVVQISDLKQAQDHAHSSKYNKMFLAQTLGKSHKSAELKDFYSLLMTESIQSVYNITS